MPVYLKRNRSPYKWNVVKLMNAWESYDKKMMCGGKKRGQTYL